MEDEKFIAIIDGERGPLFKVWPYCADHPIPEREYHFMVKDAAWCRAHAPDDPKANPLEPVDLNRMRPLF